MKDFAAVLFICIQVSSFNVFANYVLRTDGVWQKPQDIEASSGLKVFWWNIGCSSTKGLSKLNESERALRDPVNQWKNLEALVLDKKISPDVIILGEYCPKYFQQKTYDLLADFFPNIYRLEKSNSLFGVRNGLRVFSKFKLSSSSKIEMEGGSFLETGLMSDCYKSDRLSDSRNFDPDFWSRPLIEIKLIKNNRNYSLFPVHLANPWRLFYICNGRSILKTGLEITYGVDNPNYHQSYLLAEEVLKRSGDKIIIGDFNAPKVFYGIGSKSYDELSMAFGESVISSNDPTLIDSLGSYSVDHAFISGDLSLKKGMVLNFAGSDHLPLYLIVE